jgi:hypothetical protein
MRRMEEGRGRRAEGRRRIAKNYPSALRLQPSAFFSIFEKINPMKRFLLIFWVLLPSAFCLQPLTAQPLNSIYENNTLVSFEKYAYGLDSAFHTSIRPYLVSDLKKTFNYDQALSSYYISKKGSSSPSAISHEPSAAEVHPSALSLPPSAFNLIFNRNLIRLDKTEFGFTIDPLFDWGAGYDFKNDRNTWLNTRGFLITGYLGKDFAFATTFYETQAKVPGWIDSYVASRGNMPGQGRVKPFGDGAWDYANASGYVSWSPGKYFNFQFGHGKQFWGDGYRSLILSDHSLYHPYGLISTQFWKIRYVIEYAQFSHPDIDLYQGSGDPVYAKKYSTMHYLSFVPGKRWNISLFESIVWQVADSAYYRGFDMNYLNPIIFLRPVQFNSGDGDNAIMGLNLRYTIAKGIVSYGQFVIDEFKIKDMTTGNGWSGNKWALQLGVKSFDLFGVQNLNLQAEMNLIRPYMYSHYNLVQNYSNAKEPLAHPSGANIKEAVVIAKYNYKRLYFSTKYVWSAGGLDDDNVNYGKNIFDDPTTAPSEYGNFITQGVYTTLNQFDVSVSFLLNPATNANFFVSAVLRKENNVNYDKSYSQFIFGFRTSLRNLYYDFF